ncbi:MAG: hypothetical protein AAGI63_18885 [Planctomycetota bacterium]
MRDLTRPNITFIVIPPFVGVLASIWPVEPLLLKALCVGLLLISLFATVTAKTIRGQFVGVAAVAILLATLVLGTPLRLAFRLSRPSLDRIAERVADEEQIQTPFWVGPFRIRKAELDRNGVVCLWTDDSPQGRTGFVRHEPSELPFNLWSHTVLDHDWQLIHED